MPMSLSITHFDVSGRQNVVIFEAKITGCAGLCCACAPPPVPPSVCLLTSFFLCMYFELRKSAELVVVVVVIHRHRGRGGGVPLKF